MPYVSLDMTNLRFLCRASEHRLLSLLANIETTHVAIRIQPCDHPDDFRHLSDLELRLLYKNSLQVDEAPVGTKDLRASAYLLAQEVPERKLNGFELESQLACIPSDDFGRYSYVPGSQVPQREGDLFEPANLKLAKRWDELGLAAARALHAPAAQQATLAPAAPRSPATRPATAPRAPAAPPRGGNRALIWQHMDQIWERAGKPMTSSAVLALRKTCMDELEQQHSIKRTSASSELGNWMKERCTVAA